MAGILPIRWPCLALAALLSVALPAATTAATSTPTAASSSSATKSKTHTTTTHHPISPASDKTASRRTTAHSPSAHAATSSRSKKGSRKYARRGQQVIDPARTREIQQALIREHYLDGEPSGAWDGATQAAMQRYQQDRGWQSKTTPDSRALIKLGLGPSHVHLLNPESAMTSVDPATPVKGADPSGPSLKPDAKQATDRAPTPNR